MREEVDVVVVGAGAAGIAAARRLVKFHSVLVLEARSRVGGRAFTVNHAGRPIDLGCGWLHSAGENEWAVVARELGVAIDKTPPPWSKRAHQLNFSDADQEDFHAAWGRFDARLDSAAASEIDRPASDLLQAGCRWNALLDAISTYINGVELDQLSVHDYSRYHNTGVNWRVAGGYGALVAASAAHLDVALNCPATLVDRSGRGIRVETPHGAVEARAAVVTVPPSVIAAGGLRFNPQLPDKMEAAEALPLGLADKVFLHIERADEWPSETRLFGAIDRTATGSYHLRPFGAAMIEGYFGGRLARELEREGEEAFAQFAIDQLVGLLGGDMRKRLSCIAVSAWGGDPYALGAYSHAKIGCAAAREELKRPVDDRLFFAGEACSVADYSTAHGAYRTGIDAAESVLQLLAPPHLRMSGARPI